MSYNLTENSNVYVNTTVGNVDLTIAQIVELTSYSVAGVKTLSSGTDDVFCLEGDLGARINIDEIKYYFSSDSVSGTVSSGIEFFYKNESFEEYSLLDTNIGNGYYYTTVTGTSAPRYVRLVHTISGTAVSGTLHGFYIMNNDDAVDFGSDGSLTSESISSSVYGSQDEIKAIAIYNDENEIRTAYISLEPQGTVIDDLVSISDSSSGPWIGIKENDQVLGDYENGWSNGNISNEMEVSNNMLILTGAEHSGTYTTKIFDNEDSNKSFVHIEPESEPNSSFITKDEDKEVRTIEIRSTNQRPKDYALARCFYTIDVSGDRYIYYKDYFRDDGTLEHTSDYLGSDGYTTSWSWYVRRAVTDFTTGNTFGFMYRPADSSDRAQLRVFSISKTGSHAYYTLVQHASIDQISNNCYTICYDYQGGTWWNIYSNYSRSGYQINQGAGYYLIRFAPNFSTVTCKQYTSYKQPYDMDCVYNNGKLWYTDRNYNQVKLIDTSGTVEAYYSNLSNLYGICATSDGGCWFISDTHLVRLDEDANYVTMLEDVGGSSLRYVVTDGEDALYIRDGNYVKRIFLDGTVDFSVYVPSAEILLRPATGTGVWVRCSDNRIRFVSKAEQQIKANISYSYYPAVMEYQYDSSGFGFNFPISIDTHWQNLEWQEVRPSKFSLPVGDDYYQARITLQSNRPSDVYDVPTTETWTPEDYFTQGNGDAPRAHRWVPSDDTNSIYINNNRLRYYGALGGSKSISSNNRWYIEGTSFDIQVYYNYANGSPFDEPLDSQEYNSYVYIRVYSLSDGYSGYWGGMRVRYRRLTDHSKLIYYRYECVDATGSHYTEGNVTGVYNYGYLRITFDTSNGQWYGYWYDPSYGWRAAGPTTYDLGEKFYVWIYTGDYGYDLDWDSFKFNSGVDGVIFNDWDTPILRGIYNQKSVELANIYPGHSKNVYLKTSLPSQDLSYVGNYNTNLKAWWEVPTN